MNKKIKAWILMTPMLIICILSISSILYEVGKIAYSGLHLGWTMQDTKTTLMVVGFLAFFVLIFRMFVAGANLHRENKNEKDC